MNALTILVPLAAILYGLWQLFAGDSVWSAYQSRMRGRGFVTVERTSEWDVRRQVSGALLVGAGALVFFLALSAVSVRSSPRSGASNSGWLDENGQPISEEAARSMNLPKDEPR